MSGLAHIFIREEEQQTADTLRLVTPATPIFLGKWLFNITLLLGLEIIIVPLFFVLMNISILNFSIFITILLLGSVGLATVSTVIAAIISQASVKGALFAVLAFPIALPILISAIHGTRLSIEGNSFSESLTDIQALFSFSVVIFTVSLLVFEFIWKK
jgi:heme exporter protein B